MRAAREGQGCGGRASVVPAALRHVSVVVYRSRVFSGAVGG